jgi:hypothetical protein
MNEFRGNSKGQNMLSVSSNRFGCRNDKNGPQPLAAGKYAVEHRLVDTFRIAGLLRQVPADRCVDELSAFRKILNYRQN